MPEVRVARGPLGTPRIAQDRLRRTVDVSVTRVAGSARSTTRFLPETLDHVMDAGVSVTVSGDTAHFAGIALGGDLVGLSGAVGTATWCAAGGEDAFTVAESIGRSLGASPAVVVSGATVRLPGEARLLARVVGAGMSTRDVGRVEEEFEIEVAAPSPVVRDDLSARVAAALSDMPFLSLPGGEAGRLRYIGQDGAAPINGIAVFSGRTRYACEYAVTIAGPAKAMIFGLAGLDRVYVTG